MGTDLGVGSPLTARYQWDFGDLGSSYNRLPGFNAAHAYNKPGEYRLRLRVTNEAGEMDNAYRTITVLPDNRRAVYLNPWGSDDNDGSTPDLAVRTVHRATHFIGNDSAPDPDAIEEGQSYLANINPKSLEVLTECRLEPSLADAEPGHRYQFERVGYFCADAVDSKQGALVFNRTVTLRDTWAKIEQKARK